jgi:hypothetical protein
MTSMVLGDSTLEFLTPSVNAPYKRVFGKNMSHCLEKKKVTCHHI